MMHGPVYIRLVVDVASQMRCPF